MSETHFRKWLYFPFQDITHDATMPGNRERYEQKYKSRLIVKQKGDPRCLADIHDDEMLIIAGHGLPDQSAIGVTDNKGAKHEIKISSPEIDVHFYSVKPTQITMTANDLAKELDETAGLPKNHMYINLITCGGAGMVAVDDTKFMGKDGVFTAPVVDNSHQHMAECLASVLAKALGLRGYTQVLVKGYPGFVNAMGQQKTLTVEASSDASKDKKQAKSPTQRAAMEEYAEEKFDKNEWPANIRPAYQAFEKNGPKRPVQNMVTRIGKVVRSAWRAKYRLNR
jgi:hypothetical protein